MTRLESNLTRENARKLLDSLEPSLPLREIGIRVLFANAHARGTGLLQPLLWEYATRMGGGTATLTKLRGTPTQTIETPTMAYSKLYELFDKIYPIVAAVSEIEPRGMPGPHDVVPFFIYLKDIDTDDDDDESSDSSDGSED